MYTYILSLLFVPCMHSFWSDQFAMAGTDPAAHARDAPVLLDR